jgi:hypothetical protein
MSNEMQELEVELSWIFIELENGWSLRKDQIETLKYACGFNPKPVCIEHLDNLFKDIGNIFRSNK